MSRADRKLAKIQAKEEKQRQNQEAWENASPFAKGVAFFIVGGLAILFIVAIVGGAATQSETNSQNIDTAKKVQAALDNLGEDMKQELASTSPYGYRGDIISVEPAIGNGTVKVKVSTYFKDSGDGIDGGQNIARRILGNVCFDVPELNSVYVVSSSGLESKSAYRSQIPGCKQ